MKAWTGECGTGILPVKIQAGSLDPTRIDLTAMIDVIFLLLIFWMTVVRLTSTPEASDLETPISDAAGLADIPRQVLTINLVGNDDLVVAGQRFTGDRLAEAIGRGELPRHVLIRADASMDATAVVGLLSSLRKTGIVAVGVAVHPAGPVSRPLGERK